MALYAKDCESLQAGRSYAFVIQQGANRLSSKTCRGRRVKCDESRPICNNCARKNRLCKYDDAAPSSVGNRTSNPAPLRRSRRAYPQDDDGQDARDSSVSGQQDTSYHSFGAASLQTHRPRGIERERSGVSLESQRDESNGIDASNVRGLEIPSSVYDSPSPNLAAIFLHVEKPMSFAPSVQSQPVPVISLGPTSRIGDSREDRSIALIVQEQIELSAAEVTIFRNYVERVSRWVCES